MNDFKMIMHAIYSDFTLINDRSRLNLVVVQRILMVCALKLFMEYKHYNLKLFHIL